MKYYKILTTILVFFLPCLAQSGEGIPSSSPMDNSTSIMQVYNPSIDILFIMDNSGSMRSEIKDQNIQNLFAMNADIFLKQLSDVNFIDYHIGVTPPMPNGSLGSRPSLEECIIKQNNDYIHFNYVRRSKIKSHEYECLNQMLNIGTDGSVIETFLSIPIAISLFSNFENFYRPQAHLGVFAITESDDQSHWTPEKAYEALVKLKGSKEKVHFSATGTFEENFPEICEVENFKVPHYHKLFKMVELSGGLLFDLCDFNYGKFLVEFAQSLIESVLTVSLKSQPDENTIEVYYSHLGESMMIPNNSQKGWTYNEANNSILLSRNLQLESGGYFIIEYKLYK